MDITNRNKFGWSVLPKDTTAWRSVSGAGFEPEFTNAPWSDDQRSNPLRQNHPTIEMKHTPSITNKANTLIDRKTLPDLKSVLDLKHSDPLTWLPVDSPTWSGARWCPPWWRRSTPWAPGAPAGNGSWSAGRTSAPTPTGSESGYLGTCCPMRDKTTSTLQVWRTVHFIMKWFCLCPALRAKQVHFS